MCVATSMTLVVTFVALVHLGIDPKLSLVASLLAAYAVSVSNDPTGD